LEEDKKPFQTIEEHDSPKNVKDQLSHVESKESEKYQPQGNPNEKPQNNRGCKK
jgi:hypothetical protein